MQIEPRVQIPSTVEKTSGFIGSAREPKVPYCTRPGYEMGNMCRYPWWTLFIRTGTLWRCPDCSRVSVLEWIEAGGWGMKSWTRYKGDK